VKERLPAVAAALGFLGSVACSAAMVLALAGLLGASAVSAGGMAGMSNSTASATDGSSVPSTLVRAFIFLLQSGPAILVLSTAVLALAVGLRRWVGVVPVVLAGLVLYWGMYLQGTRLVMYAAIVVGMAGLAAAYIWSTRRTKGDMC